MQTIEFVPFDWVDDDFNPEIDRIEVDSDTLPCAVVVKRDFRFVGGIGGLEVPAEANAVGLAPIAKADRHGVLGVGFRVEAQAGIGADVDLGQV